MIKCGQPRPPKPTMPTLTLSFAPSTADAAVRAPKKNLRVFGSDATQLLVILSKWRAALWNECLRRQIRGGAERDLAAYSRIAGDSPVNYTKLESQKLATLSPSNLSFGWSVATVFVVQRAKFRERHLSRFAAEGACHAGNRRRRSMAWNRMVR